MSEKIQGHVGIAQIDGVPISLGQKEAASSLPVVLPSDGTMPLPTDAATATLQTAGNVLTGAVNETAPASDTASSGLNGRLQRIAQRITSLIALIPAALDAFGCFKVGHGKTIKTVSGSFTADTDVIAAVTSKRIKVTAYSFFTFGTSATTITLKSNGTGGTEVWRVCLQSIASQVMGLNLATNTPGFLFGTAAGEKLTADTNTSDTIHYSISYYDDDAT